VLRYRHKISGPLVDRIDLHVEVLPMESDGFFSESIPENSAVIRERVFAARRRQEKRFADIGILCNAGLAHKHLEHFCALDGACKQFLQQLLKNSSLSMRSYHRILKVSRTIADLSGAESIGVAHLAEAIQYRVLDRSPFEL